jgi:hypothetical protein
MKKYFVFAVFMLFAVTCFSQDYIYLKTGEVLKVTGVEEDAVTVRYQYFDDTSKKLQFVEKSGIFKIVYQNGKEVTYNPPAKRTELRSVYARTGEPFSEFHAGFAFPQGDFADKYEASTGFNLGYKHYRPLYASYSSFVFGLNGFYNKITDGDNIKVKDIVTDAINSRYTFTEFTRPAFLNFSATIGLNLTHPISDGLSIFGEVLGGLNWSKVTDVELDGRYNGNGGTSDFLHVRATFDHGLGFCYSLRGGILINKNISIGLGYNDLNSYKYKMKVRVEEGSNSSIDDKKFSLPSIAISNLTISMGILF